MASSSGSAYDTGFLAALAPDVDVVHARVERARAHQRVGRDEIVEAVAAHARSMSVASGDSNWNTPPVRPARSIRYVFGIVVEAALESSAMASPARSRSAPARR